MAATFQNIKAALSAPELLVGGSPQHTHLENNLYTYWAHFWPLGGIMAVFNQTYTQRTVHALDYALRPALLDKFGQWIDLADFFSCPDRSCSAHDH